MPDLSFDDLIPKTQSAANLSFDDLIPQDHQSGILPAALHYAGLTGRDLLEGASAVSALPGDLAVAGINKLAGSHIKSPSQGFDDYLTSLGVSQAQTAPQRLYSDVVKGATGGALMGPAGSLIAAPAAGAASGLASGSAREMGAGPYGQFAAGLIAGGATSIPSAIRSTPAQIASAALKNLTPAQSDAANILMAHAKAMGTPITPAEALAHVQGSNPLQAVQRVIEQSKAGQDTLGPMMNARPANNTQAFQGVADSIAPAPQNPYQTPFGLAGAAQSKIDQTRMAINEAARPNYQAAEDTTLVDNPILQNPRVQQAVQQVTANPNYQQLIAGADPASIKVLDLARRSIGDARDAAAIKGENTDAWLHGSAHDALQQAMEQASPEYQQAVSTVRDKSQALLNPLQQGPVGALAATLKDRGEPLNGDNAMTQQMNILMPNNPSATNASTISGAVGDIGPQNVAPWTRQALEAKYAQATRNNVPGENQWGGAKFAATVSGNPKQADNLNALVSSSAGPDAQQKLANYLNVMGAQGKRLPTGSATAFNQQMIHQLQNPDSAVAELGPGLYAATKGDPTAGALKVGDYLLGKYHQFKYGQNTSKMAEVLSNSEDLDKLRTMAQNARYNPATAALMSSILAANGTANVSSRQ